MSSTVFGGGLIKTRLEGDFLFMSFSKEVYFTSSSLFFFARNRQVGKLDFEQQKCVQDRE